MREVPGSIPGKAHHFAHSRYFLLILLHSSMRTSSASLPRACNALENATVIATSFPFATQRHATDQSLLLPRDVDRALFFLSPLVSSLCASLFFLPPPPRALSFPHLLHFYMMSVLCLFLNQGQVTRLSSLTFSVLRPLSLAGPDPIPDHRCDLPTLMMLPLARSTASIKRRYRVHTHTHTQRRALPSVPTKRS